MRSFPFQTNFNYNVAFEFIFASLRATDGEHRQLRRLRNVLFAASERTRHYRALRGLRKATRNLSLPECLEKLPAVPLLDFLQHSDRFESHSRWPELPRRFWHPFSHTPRTAILSEGYLPGFNLRMFPNPFEPALSRYEPEMLGGPIDTLRALANAKLRGLVWLPPVRFAVIAFTGILEGSLSLDDRKLFWQAFGVPVFEQFHGFAGELLAWECEIHEGLHICEKAAIFERGQGSELLISFLSNKRHPVLRMHSGLAAEWQQLPCDCGTSGPRIVNLRRRTLQLAAAV